jgi:hypothetical protein
MNNHRRLQMQFEFINPQKLKKPVQIQQKPIQIKPKPVQTQHKHLVRPTTSKYVCECVKDRPKFEINEQLIWQIEQQVKQQQQIVDEWDKEFERMRVRELEIQRTDLIRELDTLIAISTSKNASY